MKNFKLILFNKLLIFISFLIISMVTLTIIWGYSSRDKETIRTTKDALEYIGRQLDKIDTYKVKIDVTVKENIHHRCEVFFKKPNYFRLEFYYNPEVKEMDGLIINDGRIQWSYTPIIKTVFKDKTPGFTIDSKGILSPFLDLNSLKYIKTIKDEEGGELLVVEAVPTNFVFMDKNKKMRNRNLMQFFIRRNGGLIHKFITYENDDVEIWEFKDYEINTELDNHLFQFQPLKDVQILEWD